MKNFEKIPVRDIEGLKALDVQLKEAVDDTIKHYQAGLITYEETARLIYEGFKRYKKELLEQVEKYETEHELTLTELTESKSHFIGWDERIITKIKTGASMFERKNRFLFDL